MLTFDEMVRQWIDEIIAEIDQFRREELPKMPGKPKKKLLTTKGLNAHRRDKNK